MFGMCPSSNSASNVEPITWEIRPVVVAVAIDCDPRNSLFRTIGGPGGDRPRTEGREARSSDRPRGRWDGIPPGGRRGTGSAPAPGDPCAHDRGPIGYNLAPS